MMKRAFLAAVAACALGVAPAAWACPTKGKAVCTGTDIPADGVDVVFTGIAGWASGLTYSAQTDANGLFELHIGGGDFSLNLDAGLTVSCNSSTEGGIDLTATPFEVDGPNCPPVNKCVPAVPAGVTFPFCASRPIGNPRAECALFGLSVLDKTDFADGLQSTVAKVNAPVALVKAANCYDAFFDVVKDRTVVTSPFKYAISHVTYCTCP